MLGLAGYSVYDATLPFVPGPPSFDFLAWPHADKALHFFAYAAVAWLACKVAWPWDGARRRGLVVIWASVTLLGAGNELIQWFMDLGRDGSLLDGTANAAGAACACLLFGWASSVQSVRHDAMADLHSRTTGHNRSA